MLKLRKLQPSMYSRMLLYEILHSICIYKVCQINIAAQFLKNNDENIEIITLIFLISLLPLISLVSLISWAE